MPDSPIPISVSDAAKLGDVPLRTVYNWVRRGRLPRLPTPPGTRTMVDWVAMEELVDPQSEALA